MSCALFALLAMAGNLSLTDPVVGTPTETDHLGFTVGGAQFELYGFVRLDAIWDDSRPQDPEVPGWILSEDGAAPPGIGAGGKNRNDFTLHPRLTRVGLNFYGPEVDGLGNPEVSAKIEIDFYNIGLAGQSPSRSALRMRLGFVKLEWEHFTLHAGQMYDIISPLTPVVNNDLVMWGAGNLGDRRPQVRGESRFGAGRGTLILQGMVGLTGADDAQDLDPAGSYGAGYRDGQTSGLPTLQARMAFRTEFQGQALEVGLNGHYAWEDPDTNFAGERNFTSSAFGIDAQVPLAKGLLLKTELWTGRNVDDIRGGIFQGINTVTGDEISSRGGFVELAYRLTKKMSVYAGVSRDNPDNGDLNTGGRASNRIWYLATRYSTGPIQLGLEYLNWTTDYVGFSDGKDNRVAAFIAYRF